MTHNERTDENVRLMNEAKHIMDEAVLLIRNTKVFDTYNHQAIKVNIDQAIAKLQLVKEKIGKVKRCSCCGRKV